MIEASNEEAQVLIAGGFAERIDHPLIRRGVILPRGLLNQPDKQKPAKILYLRRGTSQHGYLLFQIKHGQKDIQLLTF